MWSLKRGGNISGHQREVYVGELTPDGVMKVLDRVYGGGVYRVRNSFLYGGAAGERIGTLEGSSLLIDPGVKSSELKKIEDGLLNFTREMGPDSSC
jgi:hypothetical protein